MKAKAKTAWSKETPAEEGWYWMKYAGKRGTVKCPARVSHFAEGSVVVSAHNDTFVEGPGHGGRGLKCGGKPDPTVRFGPKIEEP